MIAVVLLVTSTLVAPARQDTLSPSARRALADVRFLADDRQEGRGVGTAGLGRAGTYIRDGFARAGLQVAFQDFTIPPDAPAVLHTKLGGTATRNVVAILPGTSPALRGEVVVIGAHYDHLGRIGGAIYHGADDNASGTAVVLGLAKAFAAAGGAPRTLVFVLFSGEEVGLVGSGHYVRHPVLPLERAAAMVNFDMVGRMREGRVTVAGVESGDALRALVTAAAAGEPLAVAYRESPFAPSDQARFYAAGVPVLFFTTGGHPDYHKPTDTADRLDTAGMARIAAVGLRVVAGLAASPRPVFVKVTPPAGGRTREASGARPAAGAFLGVSVDGEGSEGLRIGAIVPDSGAERGGLRPGDVVIRIDESGIGGFEDLVAMLGRRRPGETARVVYLRDGEAYTVPVTLGERP